VFKVNANQQQLVLGIADVKYEGLLLQEFLKLLAAGTMGRRRHLKEKRNSVDLNCWFGHKSAKSGITHLLRHYYKTYYYEFVARVKLLNCFTFNLKRN
jgi:hypothetical protein